MENPLTFHPWDYSWIQVLTGMTKKIIVTTDVRKAQSEIRMVVSVQLFQCCIFKSQTTANEYSLRTNTQKFSLLRKKKRVKTQTYINELQITQIHYPSKTVLQNVHTFLQKKPLAI